MEKKFFEWLIDISSSLSDSYRDSLLFDILHYLNDIPFIDLEEIDENFIEEFKILSGRKYDIIMSCKTKENLLDVLNNGVSYLILHDNSELSIMNYFD